MTVLPIITLCEKVVKYLLVPYELVKEEKSWLNEIVPWKPPFHVRLIVNKVNCVEPPYWKLKYHWFDSFVNVGDDIPEGIDTTNVVTTVPNA